MSLAVTLDGQPITKQISGLVIKSVSPGGFASVSFNLNRSLDKSLLEQFTDVLVWDSSTGEQVSGGRLMDQGRNDDGTWSVACLGEGLASMQDRKTPTFYIDQMLENWVRTNRTTKRMDFSITEYPGNTSFDDPVLMMDTTDGQPIATSDYIQISNKIAVLCDQFIGGFGYRIRSGRTDADWDVRPRTYNSTFTTFDSFTTSWVIGTGSRLVQTVNGGIVGVGRQIAACVWLYTGTGVTPNASYWSAMRDPIIRAQIYAADGTLRTTGYTNEYILPHEVATDWVVRYAPRLDAANGVIDTSSTTHIDQMTYLDGVHGMQLLDDVQQIDPAFRWHVWEQGSNGKWPFYFTPLPTTVRYEATVADGFSAPSPTTEVWNRATVTGKTPGGRDVNLTVNSTVQALDDAGIIREDSIPLGTEIWSTANAASTANDYLADHAVPPNAGTLNIARKIQDNETGRWVAPHNIRPGSLIRVRGVQPTPDTLNATAPDGVTVFLIVSVEYNNDTGVATLELDEPTLTESRAIAKLARARVRR